MPVLAKVVLRLYYAAFADVYLIDLCLLVARTTEQAIAVPAVWLNVSRLPVPKPHFVILNAVKDLVLYRDITPFQREKAGKPCRKDGIRVLGDEILHCVQNDKKGFWVL
jgi:hypothetical protein